MADRTLEDMLSQGKSQQNPFPAVEISSHCKISIQTLKSTANLRFYESMICFFTLQVKFCLASYSHSTEAHFLLIILIERLRDVPPPNQLHPKPIPSRKTPSSNIDRLHLSFQKSTPVFKSAIKVPVFRSVINT